MKCSNKNRGILAGVILACKNSTYDSVTFAAKITSGEFVYLPAMDVADANVAPSTYSRLDGTSVDTSLAKRGVTLTIDADDFLSARFETVESGDYFAWKVYKNTKNELSLQTDSNGGMFGVVLSGITTTEPGLSSAPVQSFTVIFKEFSAICMKYIDIQAIPYVNIVCAANTVRTTTSVTSTLLCGGLPAFESATGFTATGTNAIVTTYALSVANGEATLTLTLSTGQAGSDTVTLVDAAGVDIFAPFDVIWS